MLLPGKAVAGPSFVKRCHCFSVTEPSLAVSSLMPDKTDAQDVQDVVDDEDDEFGSAGVLDDSFTRKKKLIQADQAVVILSGVTVTPDSIFQLEDTTTTVKIFLHFHVANDQLQTFKYR